MVALNFASEGRTVHLPGLGGAHLSLSTDPDRSEGALGAAAVRLGPCEGVVVEEGLGS